MQRRPLCTLGPVVGFVALLVAAGCHDTRVTEPQNEVLASAARNTTSALQAGAATLPQVSGGYFHTCALKVDGHLVCWGMDHFELLTPPAGTFSEVNVGMNAVCAIRTDGTLACWGQNIFNLTAPPTGRFVHVSVGAAHACAIRNDGTVACWGDSADGRAAPPSGTFSDVSAGQFHSCAVRTDGTVVCWGRNSVGESSPLAGAFTQVNAGWEYSCGLRPDGSLACWGGHGWSTIAEPAGAIDQLSEDGFYHLCAVKTNGTVACWGNNVSRQATPPTGIFRAVSAGSYHSCGVRADGSVACWGNNSKGQSTPPVFNQAPVANAGPDQNVEATRPSGALVTLNGGASTDADNDPLTYTWSGAFGTASGVTVTVAMPLGLNTVTLTVSDGQETSTDDVLIDVVDTTAPETGITGVVDGTGVALTMASSTLSATATFSFSGSDAVGVTGFECRIDTTPFAPCISAATFTGLGIGRHHFQVRAGDAAGNVDASPASFGWEVITPSKATENLIAQIGTLGLANGTANSLAAPLGQIPKLLNDGNPSNDGAACGKLDAFLSQVGAKAGNGQLTATQAGALNRAAGAIKLSLGC